MKFIPGISMAAALLMVGSSFVQAAASATGQTLTIRNDVAGNSSSPILYGLMYEDINRCGDSGIYAQMLRNWNFQANDTGGDPSTEFWSVVKDNGSSGSIAIDTSVGLNDANKNSLRLDVKSGSGRVGIANEGWWGLRVQPDEAYTATFFAKSDDYHGSLNVTLESSKGEVLASSVVHGINKNFKKYTVTLKPDVDAVSTDNRFVVSVDAAKAADASIYFQVFSLFGETYKGRENGLRVDLAEKLEGLKPDFFRFPGGNNLEGQSIPQRWKWNETIGPLEDRIGRFGDWTYWNTNGQGLLDYMYMCEDMNMIPILDVYAGYSLDKSSVAEDDLEPYVQDVLNQLEYLMGDASTTYGKLRAQHGRKEPFKIPMVEIGNEDFFSTTYDYRYAKFYDAITEKYPDLIIIETAKQTSRPYDYIDDHFYVTTEEMVNNFNYYDNYARHGNGSGIFVGEFATNTAGCCGTSPANLEAALADGVFITGLERNSDFVKMIAYAPTMKRLDQEQWDPDMIHFNTETVYGAPFYYVFQMYSEYRADTILQVDADNIDYEPLYWVAGSNKEKNQIYVKVINREKDEQPVTINLKGVSVKQGTAVVVAGDSLDDENTLDAPNKIISKKSTFDIANPNSLQYTFKPYSATVLVLDLKN
ncbi:glycoside hydrolase superfamily [Syncephalastrum racemosum]|uniref:non-reducing end alpha-L-arabinofuranosidase n=1 Tax=Syncephalastrum racemosum TaxID=13706 RepID=A0A1X2H518_SYNRA|nr:glycoside hydrolase superfamily [Syncephalastrum racemosum]